MCSLFTGLDLSHKAGSLGWGNVREMVRLAPALILHHSLIQKLFTNYSARRHERFTSWLATARMETTRGPTYSMARVIGGYRMAKRFHLLMPLYVLPLTVGVTHHMDRPLQWQHR